MQVREYVLQRDSRICQYCGKAGGRLETGHVIPHSRSAPYPGASSFSCRVTAAPHDLMTAGPENRSSIGEHGIRAWLRLTNSIRRRRRRNRPFTMPERTRGVQGLRQLAGGGARCATVAHCCHWSDCSAIGWRRSRLAFVLFGEAVAGRVQRFCLFDSSGCLCARVIPEAGQPRVLAFGELFRPPVPCAGGWRGVWGEVGLPDFTRGRGTRANQSWLKTRSRFLSSRKMPTLPPAGLPVFGSTQTTARGGSPCWLQ